MSVCDDWIRKMEISLPEQCSAIDMVNAGLLASIQSAANFRHQKKGPDYFKLGGRVMYPRESVIKWLKENKYESSQAGNRH